MQEVFGTLAGAFLSGFVSLCIGLVLFQRLALKLERTEYLSLAFVAGSACFSEIIFFLSSIHLARTSAFISIGLLVTAVAFGLSKRISASVRLMPLPRQWMWLAAALFACFGVVYLVNAMAPEMSPDGAAYHLPFVDRYLHAHGFEKIEGDFYASLPQGIELLFLPAVALGGHSSAAMVHFLFLVDLPLMMVCYGRRFGFPIPAAAAAFLVFASPLMGWDGTSAYVDVAAATVLFALFYLLQVWEVTTAPSLLIPIGILAGFSFAVKYTAGIGVPYAIGFVSWRLWRSQRPILKSLFTVSALAAIYILPWMIKNAVETGNPLAPFANHLFPNPFVHVSFEHDYRAYLRHYHLTNWLAAPWELAVKGERLQGFFGPVFLLMPLALLSLRRAAGRRLLLAGAFFALPWFLNIGSRFLIPALPPLSLALAFAVELPSWLLAAVMALHAFLSWYASPVRYFDRYAPRIAAVPVRAAFRVETEEEYLARGNPGYLIDRMIERQVPPGKRVFSLEPIPLAWTMREIVDGQNGAKNEMLADILRTALMFGACPVRAVNYQFPPTLLRRVRALQTARLSGEMWSVSEFQLLEGGKRLVADRTWRMTSNPNPWDARFAFDGSLVTRWRSWEDAAPGMYLEADLGEPRLIDRVSLLVSSDAVHSHARLRGMDAVGQWRDLSGPSSVTPVDLAANLREQAIRAMLAQGIHYLLVTPTTFGANDFSENAAAWGIRKAGESEGARLYHLDPDHAAPRPAEPVTVSREGAAPPGEYDDADPRMRLRLPWTRDSQFQDAYRHTLTYSNIPGSSVSLTFSGDAITYIYTRASNRGIAEVWIDDQLRDRLDLYGPSTAWKSRRRYDGLRPGEHVIEVRTTGLQNPRAAGCFVDLDGFIVE